MATEHSEEAVKRYQDTVREAERKLESRIGTGANIPVSESQAARAEYQAAVDAARADLEKGQAKQQPEQQQVRR